MNVRTRRPIFHMHLATGDDTSGKRGPSYVISDTPEVTQEEFYASILADSDDESSEDEGEEGDSDDEGDSQDDDEGDEADSEFERAAAYPKNQVHDASTIDLAAEAEPIAQTPDLLPMEQDMEEASNSPFPLSNTSYADFLEGGPSQSESFTARPARNSEHPLNTKSGNRQVKKHRPRDDRPRDDTPTPEAPPRAPKATKHGDQSMSLKDWVKNLDKKSKP
jgi:hypothetical protein